MVRTPRTESPASESADAGAGSTDGGFRRPSKKSASKKKTRKKATSTATSPSPKARKTKVVGAATARKAAKGTATKKTAASAAPKPIAAQATVRPEPAIRGVRPTSVADAIAQTEHWFEANGWTVFEFQRETWQAWHDGESGLVHSPTGSGKTLAAWLGPLQEALSRKTAPTGLEVLWITPLRALATDTARSLNDAVEALGGDLSVELRTGDTPSHQRARQRKRPPFALITTPESLSIMLSSEFGRVALEGVHTVIVDEWHELMGSKRGVMLQLGLARLRALRQDMRADLRIWGLSATLANLDEALDVLIGPGQRGRQIRGVAPREIVVDTLLPEDGRGFAWAGHYGARNPLPAIAAFEAAQTTLMFTNTRAQAEIWYQAIVTARPDLAPDVALHHGSIDRDARLEIEERLRRGTIRCVVCTSSLDLGVDFSPVEQVMQVGSPKGVARLAQRAGRSGHRPGAISRVLCVPTNAFELVEIHAAREALRLGRIEGREPPIRSLDVLCQHLVTVALGEGFEEEAMLAEVRLTHCFHDLTDDEWRWVMDFITRGGQALQGYPQYHKVMKVAGLYRVMNEQVAYRHRTHIGTIAGSSDIDVAFLTGKRIGSMPEGFVARLKRGDVFQFGGKRLELVRIKDTTAYVRIATRKTNAVPRWYGTQMSLSSELADTVVETLDGVKRGTARSPELDSVADYLALQASRSWLPGPDDFLIERIDTREGHGLYFYPFAGRLAHEGLSMLVALRLSADRARTFTLQVNDYGFELMSAEPVDDIDEAQLRDAFSGEDLVSGILDSINAGELTQRTFRDIARISGLVFEGNPGKRKNARQVQVSSGLIYEVLVNYDSENLLLDQARREVLQAQLEYQRLEQALTRIAAQRWIVRRPDRLTPFSFPLWADSLRAQTLSSESVQDRIDRMVGAIDGGDASHGVERDPV